MNDEVCLLVHAKRAPRVHASLCLSIEVTDSEENTMCVKVTCDDCKKATWSGCGEHIEQALAGVAAADRCSCNNA